MTVVDTVAGTVDVEVVAVEAVVGKVFDFVVAAEVVENIVVVVRRMAVLVAWLHLPYSPLQQQNQTPYPQQPPQQHPPHPLPVCWYDRC